MDASAQLAAWRKAKHLKLRQVAARVGCDPSTLNKIERRKRRPGRDLADKLEKHAGIAAELWKRVRIVDQAA
jgi:transcriptional regulator with XRE-family HTH domain